MDNSNHIIQSFWKGVSLSVMEQLCIESFLQNGHEFHLYCYETVANVPENCVVLDANTIVNIDKIFYDSRGGITGFANYFRVHLLQQKGGWWIDLDMVCLKPFDFEGDYCFCSELDALDNINYSNCCIKAPKNSEFIENYISIFDEMLEKHNPLPWGLSGPVLITQLLKSYSSDEFIQIPDVFCPIKWSEVQTLISDNTIIPSNPYAIHLYNERWRLNAMDKNKTYPESCIYETLKQKYLN